MSLKVEAEVGEVGIVGLGLTVLVAAAIKTANSEFNNVEVRPVMDYFPPIGSTKFMISGFLGGAGAIGAALIAWRRRHTR